MFNASFGDLKLEAATGCHVLSAKNKKNKVLQI